MELEPVDRFGESLRDRVSHGCKQDGRKYHDLREAFRVVGPLENPGKERVLGVDRSVDGAFGDAESGSNVVHLRSLVAKFDECPGSDVKEFAKAVGWRGPWHTIEYN